MNGLCTVKAARGTGTGFAFLKPNWIVTARHVVSGQPPARPIQLSFRERDVPARVLFEHPYVDLAVLEVIGHTPCRAPLMPGDGAPVVSCQRTTRQRDGYEEILFIFPAPRGEPGRSGSPLLAPDGSVVGVVVDGITLGGQNMVRATSIAPVVDMMFETRP